VKRKVDSKSPGGTAEKERLGGGESLIRGKRKDTKGGCTTGARQHIPGVAQTEKKKIKQKKSAVEYPKTNGVKKRGNRTAGGGVCVGQEPQKGGLGTWLSPS